jgi:hypothetical protein
MSLQQYVSEYLENASIHFLQEIIDHGIYNTGANVSFDGSDYDQILFEFENEANRLLKDKTTVFL